MNIVVRETVEVPVQAEPMTEINLPIEWLHGEWYMARKMRKVKKERRERIMQIAMLIGMVAFMVGCCWFMGGM